MSSSSTSSLGKRYFFKLFSNIASIPLYLVFEAILPRALGPVNYGNYNFATTFFAQIITFFDLGTSTCLTTKLAQRQHEFSLVSFYLRTMTKIAFLLVLCSSWIFVPDLLQYIMPDIPLWVAIPAVFWALFKWIAFVMRGINDATGVTVASELLRTFVNVISAIALLCLFYTGLLGMPVVYLHQYATSLLLIAGYYYTVKKMWPQHSWQLSPTQKKGYSKEFRSFCIPLAVMIIIVSACALIERWMLQYFAGSIDQGFFSLGQKAVAACFLFITAMVPLLTRELAMAYGKQDLEASKKLIDMFGPLLYGVAAYFACFSCAESPAIIRLFGGTEYADALVPVQIMMLFSLSQTYNQICGAIFYVTAQTRILCNLSIITSLFGLIMAFLMTAPTSMGGLNLGATGLAIKMVGVQTLTVIVYLYACRRIIPFGFWRCLSHQLYCPAILLGVAICCRAGTQWAGLGASDSVLRFFLSGTVYTVCCGVLLVSIPAVFGTNRQQLRHGIATVQSKITRKSNKAV